MSNIQTQRILGNWAYFDFDGHRRRMVEAFGPDVMKYIAEPREFQPTGGTGTDPRGWTTTVVEAGTGTSEVEASPAAGEVLRIITAQDENDGVNMQLFGDSFELTADQHLYFGIRVKFDEATQSDFFAGLAIVDTDILGGVTDRIGFEKLDGSTDVGFMVEKNSTETKSSAQGTAADATYQTLEFYWDGPGNALTVFIDGAEVTAPALTNLPNDVALRVTLQLLSGQNGSVMATVQWLRVFQIGR